MSFLYLFSPLFSEFNIILHKISHQFVIEDHHAQISNEEKHHHIDDHISLAVNHIIEDKDHHTTEETDDHTHDVISFLNTIFNYDSSNEKKEKQIFENKIDKHILSNYINLPQSVLVNDGRKLWDYFFFIKGHIPDITIPPPQSNIS